ncbi:MAG: type II/IV secretion system ATPase subunit [Chloroflexi bacterium]|nr:type II/IV secretion system ATPase subunit [Chloroflexota bacterium]
MLKIGPLRITTEVDKTRPRPGNGAKQEEESVGVGRRTKDGGGRSIPSGLRSLVLRGQTAVAGSIPKVGRTKVVLTEEEKEPEGFDSPLFQQLSPQLQQHSKAQEHLWSYLCDLPIDKIGVPAYYSRLSKQEKNLEDRNLIYPVGKGVFVHIYPDATSVRDSYVSVEPSSLATLGQLMDDVDERLLDYVDQLDSDDNDPEQRTENLLACLDLICSTKDRRFRRGVLKVTESQLDGLRYLMVRDKEGMGSIEPMINDPYIEDISCSGVGALFVEHKMFGGLTSNITFGNTLVLDQFVIKLSERIGRPVTMRQPIVDAVLPDGSRVNIVYGDDVSKKGSNFTIRKFNSVPMSLLDLIELGTLSYEMAAYLSITMGVGLNAFICGETASGKTTLLNALTALIPATHKIISIEDTAELQVPHPNWTREVVRGRPGEGSAVSMFDLLRAAMRQRPNEIIIGEIRGEEGAVAFQAMQTGHTCYSTFHASSVEKLIQRLTGHPINIPKTYIDQLSLAIVIGSVRLADGTSVRRITSINEIISYDTDSDSFNYIEVFRWNSATDVFEFPGYMNSNMMEEVVAPKMGLSRQEARKMYDIIEERALSFRKMHDRGITNFYDFYKFIAQAYRQGLFG